MQRKCVNKVYLGLPAFNEVDSINPLFEKIFNLINSSTYLFEIIFYDDGCTDGTKNVVKSWGDRIPITYIDGEINKGLGAGMNAILSFFAENSHEEDVLVVMDCDDTHDPTQIPQMIERYITSDQVSVVIASRYRMGSNTKGVAINRMTMSIIAAVLYKIIHPIGRVRDYTCGYRLYTHHILNQAISKYSMCILKEKGFACMVELLLKLKAINAKMTEVPMLLRYDNKRSVSKMDVSANAFRLLRKLIAWRIRGFA